MSTMNSPTGYTKYEDLQEKYDRSLTLIPYGATNTVLTTCKSIYGSLNNILYNHLIDKNVIDKETSPQSYEFLKVHQNGITDGFKLLYTIIQQQSTHLGGYRQDP